MVAEFFYLALETDFRPQLRRVKEFDPDVVFLPGSFTDATLVAAQAALDRARRDAARRRRLVEPAAVPAGRPARRGLLRRAVPALAGVRGALRGGEPSEPPGCRAVLAYDAVRGDRGRPALARAARSEALGGRPRRDARAAARRDRPHRRRRPRPAACASTRAATASRASRSRRSSRRRQGPRAHRAGGWGRGERPAPLAARPEPARQGRARAGGRLPGQRRRAAAGARRRCSPSSASGCSSRTAACCRRCAATTSATSSTTC